MEAMRVSKVPPRASLLTSQSSFITKRYSSQSDIHHKAHSSQSSFITKLIHHKAHSSQSSFITKLIHHKAIFIEHDFFFTIEILSQRKLSRCA
jgi:hypothetical protein